ncbi:MAG TPA: RodZ domain-containing protein, partial [Acetobacteraceae bacterium]
ANGALTIVPAAGEDLAPPPPAISPTSAAAASVQGSAREMMPGSVAPETGLAVPVLSTPPTQAAATVPDDSRIVLRANALTWLMVKDKTGSVLLNRTLKPGEIWPVPPRGDLLLTTGNAAGTDILLDGAVTAGLGGAGVVRRDLPLDIDQIHDGKLAPVINPQLASSRPRQ